MVDFRLMFIIKATVTEPGELWLVVWGSCDDAAPQWLLSHFLLLLLLSPSVTVFMSRCVFLRRGRHGAGFQVTGTFESLWHRHDDHGEGKTNIRLHSPKSDVLISVLMFVDIGLVSEDDSTAETCGASTPEVWFPSTTFLLADGADDDRAGDRCEPARGWVGGDPGVGDHPASSVRPWTDWYKEPGQQLLPQLCHASALHCSGLPDQVSSHKHTLQEMVSVSTEAPAS